MSLQNFPSCLHVSPTALAIEIHGRIHFWMKNFDTCPFNLKRSNHTVLACDISDTVLHTVGNVNLEEQQ